METASRSLAILVIDENRIRASIIEAGLRDSGHETRYGGS